MTTAYVTAPRAAADEIARHLIDERLAACVNRVDCESTYRWEGEVYEEAESVLFIKTTEAAYDDLVSTVREVHPHDVPCIERFDEAAIDFEYARWRDGVVAD